ncbi:MAG: HpcH/HpaI aldolase/citrate lyase family protein, partial [Mycobacteriaceae bacterium]
MIHFDFLSEGARGALFHHAPKAVDASNDLALQAMHLGATLYCPATRLQLVQDIVRSRARGVSSMVLCLEDSVPNDQLAEAENNLVRQLQ